MAAARLYEGPTQPDAWKICRRLANSLLRDVRGWMLAGGGDPVAGRIWGSGWLGLEVSIEDRFSVFFFRGGHLALGRGKLFGWNLRIQ